MSSSGSKTRGNEIRSKKYEAENESKAYTNTDLYNLSLPSAQVNVKRTHRLTELFR